jgi:hypothetical protein
MDFSKKPIFYFTIVSSTLLIAYIYIFIKKTNFFPISEIFSWLSSIIIVLLIVNTLYESQRVSNSENISYTIVIYLLLIGCALCSLGIVWNASTIPEIKLKFSDQTEINY